jgi:hypothetical protein
VRLIARVAVADDAVAVEVGRAVVATWPSTATVVLPAEP